MASNIDLYSDDSIEIIGETCLVCHTVVSVIGLDSSGVCRKCKAKQKKSKSKAKPKKAEKKRPKSKTESELRVRPKTSEESAKVCSICLENMDKNQIRIDCNHCFHRKCLKPWKDLWNTCPLCRKTIRTVRSVSN